MDISKASNFERYIFDVVGRDPAVVRALWASIEREGGFELAGAPHRERVAASGFVSGVSTHADRIATIRRLHSRHRIVVDPHTADGIKVGLERRDPAVPLVCIETALAGEIQRDDQGSDRPRARAAPGLRGPGAKAAALRRAAGRRRSRQGLHRRSRAERPHDERPAAGRAKGQDDPRAALAR